MLTLERRTDKPVIEGIIELAENQKQAGLGDTRKYAKSYSSEHLNQMEKLGFTLVNKPKALRLDHHGTLQRAYPWALPKVALANLSSSESTIRIWSMFLGIHEAPIPFIPRAAQELAIRAKAACPSLNFWLLFEVSKWTYNEAETAHQRDPILLGEIYGDWFEIAAWDGDQDLCRKTFTSKAIKPSWLSQFMSRFSKFRQ